MYLRKRWVLITTIFCVLSLGLNIILFLWSYTEVPLEKMLIPDEETAARMSLAILYGYLGEEEYQKLGEVDASLGCGIWHTMTGSKETYELYCIGLRARDSHVVYLEKTNINMLD